MPFTAPTPFAEPPEFARLRAREGPVRVRTAAGDCGWLVTRYSDVRALCADRRIGRSHPDPASAPRLWPARLFDPPGDVHGELAGHRRLRALLVPAYGRRRVAGERARAQAVLDEILSTLVAGGSAADLHAELALPYSMRAVFGFVGVPEAEWELYRWRSHWLREPGRMAEQPGGMRAAMSRMVERERGRAGEDVITRLAGLGTEAATEVLCGPVGLVEYETVAARICYGLLHLLADQAQLRRLVADPGLAPAAVEEIMRVAVPGGSWIPRYALARIDLGEARIRAGDLVVLSMQAANRDARWFPDPGAFLIDRVPNPHLGFGHGKFYCLGAHLTRLLLHQVLTTALARLPGLRLAVPVEEVECDRSSVTGGLRALPVTW
ncbi:cytochrome P450 [Nonomuraea endophytica]|uniref:Pentalenolactone synthase n=1 Tax=Nonomuraea endophytica TaxID=714136 RepID=A0A7W8EJE8_9ACTN|nr:cytochrome P450 [Nonomuraea endophytica]MBB5080607.1 pentalenolactone synthase [Nonomuraea endophytica]